MNTIQVELVNGIYLVSGYGVYIAVKTEEETKHAIETIKKIRKG